MAATKRRRYSDNQRADLVVMLISEGYPDKKGALQKVADYAKVPAPTLHRWFKEKQNPPPSNMVNEKVFDLRQALQTEIEAIFNALPDMRATAEYKDLTRALGIITDKILLLDGKATSRVAITWEDQAVEDIRAGRVEYPALAEAFDESTATRLFAAAGIPAQVGTGEVQE